MPPRPRARAPRKGRGIMMPLTGTNTGHGRIWPRPDGLFTRCGGQPELCTACAQDARLWYRTTGKLAIAQWQMSFDMYCLCGRRSAQHLRQRLPGSFQTGIVVCPTCRREYFLMGCAVASGPRLILRTEYEAMIAALRHMQQTAETA